MSAVFKILNGTQRGDTDLCPSCRSRTIWTDERGEHRFCNARPSAAGPLRGQVSSCTDYESASETSIHHMREIAWTLRTEKGGKMIGFSAPKLSERKPWDDVDD